MSKRRGKPWSIDKLPEPIPPLQERDPGWETRSLRLLAAFNACVVEVNKRTGRSAGIRRPTRVNLEVLWALDLWCVARRLDPFSWIYAAFARTSWKMYAGQARLFDEKNRNVYDNLNGIDAGTILALAPQPAPPFRVGQDMSWGAEAAKRRYAQRQRPDLCMASFDLTLGYHLESAICRSCPCASECGPRTAQILKELMR